ncbi:MDR family MFS transporter [Streptomyces sp. NPDC047046]|uniref:MDR family MFS transporter n=1 Tax=Streptomyces sp. NPDC047046 TaxID=3155378 RepID=UPI0033E8EB7B
MPSSLSPSAPPGPAPGAPAPVDPAVWRLAFTVVVGALAVVFDTTIVTVALHDLTRSLHASLATIQWVSTGYLLAVFVTIPLAKWAQARVGGKRLWTGALTVFLLGSVLSALAWNAPALIAFRVVQGIGGGIMMPLMATLIMQAAKGREIGRVMATVTLPTALGPILGPVLGGLILSIASWRWLFLVNIPFCLVGAVLAYRDLPDDRPAADAPRPRLDVLGLLLLSPGVAALLYGLSRVEGSAGFTSAGVLVPLLAGLVLVLAFVARSLPRAHALINLRLLRHRAPAASAALLFLGGTSLYGAMLLLPLYWQQVRGQGALGAGLLLIPQGLGALAARTRAGHLTDRLGPRPVALAGFALVTLGTLPFALADAHTDTVLLLAALFLRGLGLGAAMVALSGAAFIGLAHHEIPDASIISRVSQQIGGSVGTAVLAVVLQHTTASAETVADGYGAAFWWALAATAVALPLSAMLPGKGKGKGKGKGEVRG